MTLRNAPRSNVRSGRFFAANVEGSNAITIIKPVEDTIYRVFNTGPNLFKVESGGLSLPIRPKSSVDFKSPSSDITVTTTLPNKEVKGSYDVIQANDRPKNGRFQLTTGQPSCRIATNDVKGLYRIFNDRNSNPIQVRIGADLIDPPLPPGSSIDLRLPTKNLTIVNTDNAEVSGSYVRFSADGFRPDADERTGRFNGSAKVIHGLATARNYRFFNAGAATIQINDGTANIDLLPKCSVDANVQNATVAGGNGFYERVRLIELKRAGRCTFVATQASEEHTIVKNATDQFYRVLNSGDDLFSLSIGGTTTVDVEPGMSLDFLTEEGEEIKVIAPAIDDVIELIYDKLDRSVDVRSGRFIGEPMSALKIVSVGTAASGATAATYRFLNAIAEPLQIYVGGSPQVTGGLLEGQSIDLKVAPPSGSSDVDISVRALTAGNAIDGIYEYVHR